MLLKFNEALIELLMALMALTELLKFEVLIESPSLRCHRARELRGRSILALT